MKQNPTKTPMPNKIPKMVFTISNGTKNINKKTPDTTRIGNSKYKNISLSPFILLENIA